MRRALALVAVLASWPAALVAQTSSPVAQGGVFLPSQGGPAIPRPAGVPGPLLDPSRSVPSGTAVIRGRITVAGAASPLRRAQVMLTGAEQPSHRSTTTDAQGRYEFARLPAGRYRVFVNKGGYVGLEYGQRRPYEEGTTVGLADGQTTASINVALPRGGVIAGRITDEFGEPLPNAGIQAMRYAYDVEGQRRLQPVGFAQTDDLGQFRVFGLMPGDYVVSASARDMSVALNFGPGNVDTTETYVPTYYPGTASVGEAQAVTLAVGEEKTVQFSVAAARQWRVAGTVVDSRGQAVTGAMLMLTTPSAGSLNSASAGMTGADGSFALGSVAPGDYSLSVLPGPQFLSSGRQAESATLPVSVGDGDLMNVRVVTSAGGSVSGHVSFEGTAPRSDNVVPPHVFPQPVELARGMMFGNGLSGGAIADDGTFELTDVWGPVFLRPQVSQAWMLKSMTLDGMDISDVPVDVTGRGAVSGVTIVLTDKLTEISGQVLDERRRPLKDYVVVLQPVGPKPAVVLPRFLRVVRPDSDGRFRVKGLPPGEYDATAVDSLEQGRQFSPEVQARLRETARRVAIEEGAAVSLDLQLTAGFN